MASNISFEDFMAVYMASKAKVQYSVEMDEYLGIPLLRRAFTRRPADPAPGFSQTQLYNLACEAFPLVFPEFGNRYIADKNSITRYKTSVDFSERMDGPVVTLNVTDNQLNLLDQGFYEFRPGYGFIPEYSHYTDQNKDNNNRIYAHEKTMGSRFKDVPQLQSVYSSFDRFRLSEQARIFSELPSSYLEKNVGKNLLNIIASVQDAVKQSSFEIRSENKSYKEFSRLFSIKSCRDYARNVGFVRAINDFVFKNPSENTGIRRAESRALHELIRGVSDEQLWMMAEKKPVLSLDALLALSKDENYVKTNNRLESSPESIQLEVYSRFAQDALNCGYSVNQISSVVKADIQSNGFSSSVEPDYDFCSNIVSRYYRLSLDKYLDGRRPYDLNEFIFGTGPSDASVYPLPSDGILERQRQVEESKKVRMFLNEYAREHGLSETDIKHIKPEAIGGFCCEFDYFNGINEKSVSVESVATFLHCPVSAVQAGYDFAYGEFVSKALDASAGQTLRYSPAENGMKVFHNEIVDAVQYLHEKGDKETLGVFCREAGILLKGNEIRKGLVDASRKMYGSGTGVNAQTVQSFRDKWQSTMSAAKKEFRKSLQEQKVVKWDKSQKGVIKR